LLPRATPAYDAVPDTGLAMLIEYIEAAMRRAKYELLPDGEGYYAEIPRFNGLWANAATLEACRKELLGALQGWILIKLRHGDTDLPTVDRMNLNAPPPAKSDRPRPSPRLRRNVA
jgi:predicted RNase H-like HicB family nuclease